jgi:hypothetical protein
VVADRSVVANRCAVADRCAADRYAAADRCVEPLRAAPVQSVVTPCGVRVVAQNEEVDRSVSAQNEVRSEARNEEVDRSVSAQNEVRSEAQNEEVDRSVVILIEVQSVALIGFHSPSLRPHASGYLRSADYSQYLAARAYVSHLPAATDALRAQASHQPAAPVAQPHLTAAAFQPTAHSCSPEHPSQ